MRPKNVGTTGRRKRRIATFGVAALSLTLANCADQPTAPVLQQQEKPVQTANLKAFAKLAETTLCGVADVDGGNPQTFGVRDLPADVASALRKDFEHSTRGYVILDQISVVSAGGVRRDIACAVPLTPAGNRALLSIGVKIMRGSPAGSEIRSAMPHSTYPSVARVSGGDAVPIQSQAAMLLLGAYPNDRSARPSPSTPSPDWIAKVRGSSGLSPRRNDQKSSTLLPGSSDWMTEIGSLVDPQPMAPVVVTATAGTMIFDFSFVMWSLANSSIARIELIDNRDVQQQWDDCQRWQQQEAAENSATEIFANILNAHVVLNDLNDREEATLTPAMCECTNDNTSLCVDFWIEAEELLSVGSIIGYGDARASNPNALSNKSRVQMYIGKDADDARTLINKTNVSIDGGATRLALPHDSTMDTFQREQVNDTTVKLTWNFKNGACSKALWDAVPAVPGSPIRPGIYVPTLCPGITGTGTFTFRSDGSIAAWDIFRDAYPQVGIHRKASSGTCAGYVQLQEDRTKKSGKFSTPFHLLPITFPDEVKGTHNPCLQQ